MVMSELLADLRQPGSKEDVIQAARMRAISSDLPAIFDIMEKLRKRASHHGTTRGTTEGGNWQEAGYSGYAEGGKARKAFPG